MGNIRGKFTVQYRKYNNPWEDEEMLDEIPENLTFGQLTQISTVFPDLGSYSVRIVDETGKEYHHFVGAYESTCIDLCANKADELRKIAKDYGMDDAWFVAACKDVLQNLGYNVAKPAVK